MTETTHTAPRLRLLAWALFGLAAFIVVSGLILTLVFVADGRASWTNAVGTVSFLAPTATFAIVGLMVALRRPANPAGWFMLVIGALWSVLVLPLGDVSSPQWFGNLVWILPLGLMGTHLLLRLPDGHLPSPRWRWISRAATLAIVVAGAAVPPVDQPSSAHPAQGALGAAGLLLLLACVLASVASLVVRARRADVDERHQLRWIAAGGVTFISFYGLSFTPTLFGAPGNGVLVQIAQTLTVLAYSAVPLGIGISILKYRLYDIDVVIRKAVMLAVIAAFFTIVYSVVVGGIGALVGSRSTPALSFLAAALVAVGFQPALTRARRFADRVVFGKRSTPYEVLAELGQRLGETFAAEDVLSRIARVLGEGVGATRAQVSLQVEGALRPVATWPADADGVRAQDLVVEVKHQGESLGSLSVEMPANDPMDPTKERLARDLAGQVGLVLRNVRLTEELRKRLKDLQAAQKRLVSAQDAERRRLERNIHDGAQQQLVALAVKLRLADGMLDRAPERVHALLEQLQAESTQALEDLRDLARGIYPPLLADRGLAAALEAQAAKAPLPVEVRSDGIGRFSQEIEAAAYFSCLEALQNVAKYAEASDVVVSLAPERGGLRFEVADDGVGFEPSQTSYGTGLQGIADRLGALEGTLVVESAPQLGTTVVGTIPGDPVPPIVSSSTSPTT